MVFFVILSILFLSGIATVSEEAILARLRRLEESVLYFADHISDPPSVDGPWHKKFSCESEGLKRPLRLVMSSDMKLLKETAIPRADLECSVLYASGMLDLEHGGLKEVSEKFEAVFIEDQRVLGLWEARGNLHFFDKTDYNELPINSLAEKRELVSFVFPSWGVVKNDEKLYAEYKKLSSFEDGALIPHIFFDKGIDKRNSTFYDQSMTNYFFTIIYAHLHTLSYPPLPFIRAFERHTIPITLTRHSDYWLPLGFRAESAVWRIIGFNPREGIPFLRDMIRAKQEKDFDELILFRQLNMRILQDLSIYRYNLPPESRLVTAACAVCKARKGLKTLTYSNVPPLVFVAIMSARENFALRQTVRQTWLSVLSGGGIGEGRFNYAYAFFIGKPGDDEKVVYPSLEDVLQIESDFYGDVVTLDVPESYLALTQKSLLMYHWVVENSPSSAFFLRVDDDMYLRPQPIFDQLAKRTPARYWWGSFAHLSSVVRNETDFKAYNSQEQYPIGEFFPMYTRGVMYALSTDLLRLIVAEDKAGNLHTKTHPDDSALGVYIYQLVIARKTFVNTDDRDENRVALNPVCKHVFSQLQNTTWAVHHVSPSQMRCMWDADIKGDYYDDYNIKLSAEILHSYKYGMEPFVNNSVKHTEFFLDDRCESISNQTDIVEMTSKCLKVKEIPQTIASTSDHKIQLYTLQAHEMMRRTRMSLEELQMQRVVIKGRRRNNFPDLCPCGIPGGDLNETSTYDSGYGRFMP